jgi:hypothetical protein
MSGVKGKSGRKPKRSTDIKLELLEKPERTRDLLNKCYDLGMQGNIRAIEIYTSYVLGKPKQEIDQTVKAAIFTFTSNDYDSMARTLLDHVPLLDPNPPMGNGVRLIEQGNSQSNIISEET